METKQAQLQPASTDVVADSSVQSQQVNPPVAPSTPPPAKIQPQMVSQKASELPNPVPAVEDAPDGFFDILTSELGDVPGLDELKLDGFYKDIRPEHVKDLPAHGRQIIHNMRKSAALEKVKLQEQLKTKESEYSKRNEDLVRREKELLRQRQEWAALIEDPKVQEMLKVDSSKPLPDAFTEEGIQARIDKATKEKLANIFKPMQDSAKKQRQDIAYMEFVEQNPEMKDPEFRTEVASMVKERNELARQGKASILSTQDAYRMVKLKKLETEQRIRQATEVQARQASARQVSKTTIQNSPQSLEIPSEVKKNANLLHQWLKDNPEAAKKYYPRRGAVVR